MERNWAVCEKAEDGKHIPDPRSITVVREVDWLVDVICELCGQATGVRIDIDKIYWS